MTTPFTLELVDMAQRQVWPDVDAFQGRDATGSFGVWAKHQDFMARCPAGISHIRRRGESIYLAAPSLLVMFRRGALTLTSRRLFLGTSPEALENELLSWLAHDRERRLVKASNQNRLEQSLMRQLRELKSDDLS